MNVRELQRCMFWISFYDVLLFWNLSPCAHTSLFQFYRNVRQKHWFFFKSNIQVIFNEKLNETLYGNSETILDIVKFPSSIILSLLLLT